MKKGCLIIMICLLILFVIVIWLYIGNNNIRVTEYKVVSTKLPQEFNGFKIVQISDLHNTLFRDNNEYLIEKIKGCNPDIIVITGDFVDYYKTNIDISISLIEKIKSIAPIYYVTGNHEHTIKTEQLANLLSRLEENDVKILNSKSEKIEKNGSVINIMGIFDLQSLGRERKNIEKITENIKSLVQDKESFNILLSHRPEIFDIYINCGLDLVLTGHTHGGQIRLPFIGGLFVPNQGWFPQYDYGRYEKNNTVMLISNGLGNSRFPLRVNNMPEIVSIELEKG